jgi:hypothetical protein
MLPRFPEYQSYLVSVDGYTTSPASCIDSGATQSCYTAPGATTSITQVFLNTQLTIPFSGTANYYYKLIDGTDTYTFLNGTPSGNVSNVTICTGTTTTTTAAPTTTTSTTTTTAAPTTTTTTSTTTTTTTSVATIDLATNNSLDIAISISGITVNGVSVTNITGIDPNTTGNGGGAQTTQIGTYTIVIPYSASTAGQSISLIDSDSVPQCQGTSTGSGVLTFTGVVVGVLQPVTITANEGACPA